MIPSHRKQVQLKGPAPNAVGKVPVVQIVKNIQRRMTTRFQTPQRSRMATTVNNYGSNYGGVKKSNPNSSFTLAHPSKNASHMTSVSPGRFQNNTFDQGTAPKPYQTSNTHHAAAIQNFNNINVFKKYNINGNTIINSRNHSQCPSVLGGAAKMTNVNNFTVQNDNWKATLEPQKPDRRAMNYFKHTIDSTATVSNRSQSVTSRANSRIKKAPALSQPKRLKKHRDLTPAPGLGGTIFQTSANAVPLAGKVAVKRVEKPVQVAPQNISYLDKVKLQPKIDARVLKPFKNMPNTFDNAPIIIDDRSSYNQDSFRKPRDDPVGNSYNDTTGDQEEEEKINEQERQLIESRLELDLDYVDSVAQPMYPTNRKDKLKENSIDELLVFSSTGYTKSSVRTSGMVRDRGTRNRTKHNQLMSLVSNQDLDQMRDMIHKSIQQRTTKKSTFTPGSIGAQSLVKEGSPERNAARTLKENIQTWSPRGL